MYNAALPIIQFTALGMKGCREPRLYRWRIEPSNGYVTVESRNMRVTSTTPGRNSPGSILIEEDEWLGHLPLFCREGTTDFETSDVTSAPKSTISRPSVGGVRAD